MNWFSIKIGHAQSCLLVLLLFAGQQSMAKPLTPFECRPIVCNAPPSWSVNPSDFEFNMSAVIRINFDGVPSNATGNIVGAFAGNMLRGVATPIIIDGAAYFFLTIYSNNYTDETLHFKVYSAADDAVYASSEEAVFVHNGNIGTLEAPFWVNIDPNADFPPALYPVLADTTLVNIPFEPVDLNDYLISLDGDPVTWSAQPGPNLNTTIVNGVLTVE